MNSLLIFISIILIYLIFFNNNNNNIKTETFDYNYKLDDKDKEKIIEDVLDSNSYDAPIIVKDILNPNFSDTQFNNNYRDVITALNNLVPDKKQRFNLANIPLKYSEPPAEEIRNIVSDFINILNVNLMSEVPSFRNPNSGWDEAIPDPNIKSGWDKIQESLGLPVSLYEKPATNNLVKLVKIMYVQKYETEDEIKYSCEVVIQKLNVDDQMIIKPSFVQDKRPLLDENNFFEDKIIDMKVIIEDIYILGYLSKYGYDDNLKYDGDKQKYFKYDLMEFNDLTDPKYIQKILMQKYKLRTEEMDQRNALLDEEGQAFHRNLPHIYDFQNIKDTQTIFDDMNLRKNFV